MAGLLKEVELHFGDTDLYKILNLSKTASASQIKKAYYKLSLLVHPDKSNENERPKATKKFQVLGRIYSILSDNDLRATYDETGRIDEDDMLAEDDRDWTEYWRTLFPKVSLNDIDKFTKNYKNSDEEKNDLIRLYKLHEGDMGEVMSRMMCSTQDDEPRFRGIIDGLLRDGEVEGYEAYVDEAPGKKKARLTRSEKEKKEAEKILKELKKKKEEEGSDDDDLRALMLKNAKSREERGNSFLAKLEEKYSQGVRKGGKSKKNTNDPTTSKKKK